MAKYYMFRTATTDLIAGGFKDVLVRDASVIARYLLMNFNEEDLVGLRGNRGRDTLIEQNEDLRQFIESFRRGQLSITKPDEPNKGMEKKLSMNNPVDCEFIKTILINLPGPEETSLNPDQKLAVQLYSYFLGKTGKYNTRDLPKKIWRIDSYDTIKKKTPDIYEEMEKFYNRQRSRYFKKINNLKKLKIPGLAVNSGTVFEPADFGKGAFSRGTLRGYLGKTRAIQKAIEVYLPIVFENAITADEATSIAENLESNDVESFILELESNVPNFYTFFQRGHGVTMKPTISNFIEIITQIIAKGETIKFGDIINLAGDDAKMLLTLPTSDASAEKDFLDSLIGNGVFLEIYNRMKNGTLEEDLNIDISIGFSKETRIGSTIKQIRKMAQGIKTTITGSGKLKAFSKRKVSNLLSRAIQGYSIKNAAILSGQATISISLPRGKYSYERSPGYETAFDAAEKSEFKTDGVEIDVYVPAKTPPKPKPKPKPNKTQKKAPSPTNNNKSSSSTGGGGSGTAGGQKSSSGKPQSGTAIINDDALGQVTIKKSKSGDVTIESTKGGIGKLKYDLEAASPLTFGSFKSFTLTSLVQENIDGNIDISGTAMGASAETDVVIGSTQYNIIKNGYKNQSSSFVVTDGSKKMKFIKQ